ncbi:MAG: ribonuclease PH [Victivallaceae bacterium]|nr:ribonuclease PH [Victivallaceae bacterium]
MSQRIDKREPDELRRIAIKKNVLSHPLSSVEISFGRTRVICTISVERAVPAWMRSQKVSGGWLTCEYGMLPGSTGERNKRESSTGRPNGRSMEIQRLIGRSLRSVVDLESLGQNTVYVDCDVIDADGGTRCASICGASTALGLALRTQFAKNNFTGKVMREGVAAISVGIVNGEPVLDLCYEEDSRAEVDMNVVMTESGKLVEVQGTAERAPFSRTQLNRLLDLAGSGLGKIFALQKAAVEEEKPKRTAKVGNLGEALSAASGEMI